MMMACIHAEAGKGRYRVEAVAVRCGGDLCVCFCGGENFHVGAAALGIPRKSLKYPSKTSATASVLCAVGHKDDEPARKAALDLAAAFSCRVNVAVGINLVGATVFDLEQLTKSFDDTLSYLQIQIKEFDLKSKNISHNDQSAE